MNAAAAICITTHNRRDELARTLGEIARLDPQPDEIVAVADGCDDGTVEFLREAHPQVRVLVHERPLGSIRSRNEMAGATDCEILVSLDDDSHPIEKDFIARVKALFAGNPRLAVASFPQRTDEDPASLMAAGFGESKITGSYANCAAALRRSAFLQLGGYPDFFFHAYEEPDFALRCIAAGWEVKLETSLTVRHHFTPAQRDEQRTHHRHARNELWSVLLRCPAPQLFAVGAFRVARQFGYAWKRGPGWVLREPVWWLGFLRGIPRCLRERRPLPWRAYLAWMKLVRQPMKDRAFRVQR